MGNPFDAPSIFVFPELKLQARHSWLSLLPQPRTCGVFMVRQDKERSVCQGPGPRQEPRNMSQAVFIIGSQGAGCGLGGPHSLVLKDLERSWRLPLKSHNLGPFGGPA